jgi:hypothetical protein
MKKDVKKISKRKTMNHQNSHRGMIGGQVIGNN